MRALILLPLLALLAACAGGIPTPQSAGLPDPEAIILASPETLPDAELCAYAAEVEAAEDVWSAYLSRWAVALGREPVDLSDLANESEHVAKLIEARRVLCAVEAPERRG